MIDNSQNIFEVYADLERPLVVSNKLQQTTVVPSSSRKLSYKHITGLIFGAMFIVACIATPAYQSFGDSDSSNISPASAPQQNLILTAQEQPAAATATVPLPANQKSASKKRTRNSLLGSAQESSLNLQGPFVPTSFDLRNQAKAVGCNFNRIDEKLCVGGNWSNVIASAVSLTTCLASAKNVEIPLSAQYILDCSTLVDRCDMLDSRENFEAQLTMVQTNGLPTAACLPYNPLNYQIAANACDTTCKDGSALVASQKPAFADLWDDSSIDNTIANVKAYIYSTGPVIALLDHSATVTRYAGSSANGIFVNDPTDQTDFGFRAYKIIAWDVAPGNIPYWILENTFSSNWGLNGYMRVELDDPIIEGYYAYTPAK